MKRVLVVGLSTRAAAASAAHAGFEVTALDAFADLDQHPAVLAHALAPSADRFGAAAASRAASALPGDAVAYLSPFENHPGAIQRLAANRRLLGNAPDVLRRARDPIAVADTFARCGFTVPLAIRHLGRPLPPGRRWLLKRLASGGGTHIREWLPTGVPTAAPQAGHVPVGRGRYLQEVIDGVPGSIAFVAAGGRAVPIGLSRQLSGDAAFGAAGHRYCGSIRLAPGDAFADRTRSIAVQLADCAALELGLVGVNGIDFIVRDDVPVPIEINPRWSGSMELAERDAPGAIFEAHARACVDGTLPVPESFALPTGAPAWGKAIVFATGAVTTGDTRTWLHDGWRRDVPRPGTRIAAGQPICTVFAEGGDAARCQAALAARAAAVFEELRLPYNRGS
jgi:predicted ATP-grasp superfamily ATP-dependent carboligase